MEISVSYETIPALVDELLAQGLTPSAKRIRERLGRGSYETISLHIKAHLRATGRLDEAGEEAEEETPALPAAVVSYTPPAPEPEAVAVRLAALRHESFVRRAMALAKAPLPRPRRHDPEAEARSRIVVEGLAAQAGLDPERYLTPIMRGEADG